MDQRPMLKHVFALNNSAVEEICCDASHLNDDYKARYSCKSRKFFLLWSDASYAFVHDTSKIHPGHVVRPADSRSRSVLRKQIKEDKHNLSVAAAAAVEKARLDCISEPSSPVSAGVDHKHMSMGVGPSEEITSAGADALTGKTGEVISGEPTDWEIIVVSAMDDDEEYEFIDSDS